MEGDSDYWEDIYNGSLEKHRLLVPHQHIRSAWKTLFSTRNRGSEPELGASQTALLCEALINGISLLGSARFRDACNLATFLYYRLPSTLADTLYKTAIAHTETAQSKLFWAMLCRQPLTDELYSCVNDNNHLPALHFATLLDNRALILQLLDKGADILIKNHEGETAFYIAAKTGNIAALDALASVSALNLHEPDNSGNTPLHAAADSGHLEVLDYLCAHGADINRRNGDGATPLLVVCEGDSSIDVARFLVDKGADIEISDESGFTPFLTAVWAYKREVATYLLDRGASPLVTESTGRGALHFAAENNDVELIQRLILLFKHLDILNHEGQTPLHVAAWYACTESAQLLLKNGANPACTTANGFTPLHFAAMQDAFDIVKCLFSYNIDINEGWQTGRTALASAVIAGNVRMVQYLLKKGALLNTPGQSAFDLLQSAVHNHHTDVVKALFLSNRLSAYDSMHFLEYTVTSGHSSITDACFESGFYLHHHHISLILRDELRRRSLENIEMRKGSLQSLVIFGLEKSLADCRPKTFRPSKPLRVMPIGYGPDGRNYLKDAMNGSMPALLWINAYDQQTPGSVTSWLKQAEDSAESFCITVNLTGLRHGCFLPLSAKQLKALYRATPDSLTELRGLHEYSVLHGWLTALANAEEMSHFHEQCQRLSHYLHVGTASEAPVAIVVPEARGQRRITEFFQPREPETDTPDIEQLAPGRRPS